MRGSAQIGMGGEKVAIFWGGNPSAETAFLARWWGLGCEIVPRGTIFLHLQRTKAGARDMWGICFYMDGRDAQDGNS